MTRDFSAGAVAQAQGERIAVVETRLQALIEKHDEATRERREGFERLDKRIEAFEKKVLEILEKHWTENSAQHSSTDKRLEALEQPFRTAGTIRDVLRVQWKTAVAIGSVITLIVGSWTGTLAKVLAWFRTP